MKIRGTTKDSSLEMKKKIIQKQKFSNSIKTLQLIKFWLCNFNVKFIFGKFNGDCPYTTSPEVSEYVQKS